MSRLDSLTLPIRFLPFPLSPLSMAPSLVTLLPVRTVDDVLPGKRSNGADDGTDHRSSFPGSSSWSGTPTGFPSPTATAPQSSSQSNTGAIAGGTVGAVAVVALLGFVWLWWRKRVFGKRVYRLEKPEIDPDDTVPTPAKHLALPAQTHPPGSDSVPSNSVEPASTIDTAPRHWQIHNASSPSLQNAIPAEKSVKVAALSIPSGNSNPTSDPFSSPTTLSSPLSSSGAPFSHHGHSTISTDDTHTSPTTVESASAAESEIAELRRRVTLLTQENARLSAAHNIIGVPASTEAPPAYDIPRERS
ncbi:hypothetical protein K435DRAFT_838119 [Dendrothele bispora CBS 962.96]|uniref:Uncharacterized protein n=1 Tax=Dendrothele bispora (strain CBS 962.96) TaxID=1314807 RepID=A0A4S8M817_DENBC|nr:hypothetical protein K435DRAFT_838119 [Dendrothele bispora CBS 962.96]